MYPPPPHMTHATIPLASPQKTRHMYPPPPHMTHATIPLASPPLPRIPRGIVAKRGGWGILKTRTCRKGVGGGHTTSTGGKAWEEDILPRQSNQKTRHMYPPPPHMTHALCPVCTPIHYLDWVTKNVFFGTPTQQTKSLVYFSLRAINHSHLGLI